jgi:SPP1 gp7 family putative phage head morphogenesis protein
LPKARAKTRRTVREHLRNLERIDALVAPWIRRLVLSTRVQVTRALKAGRREFDTTPFVEGLQKAVTAGMAIAYLSGKPAFAVAMSRGGAEAVPTAYGRAVEIAARKARMTSAEVAELSERLSPRAAEVIQPYALRTSKKLRDVFSEVVGKNMLARDAVRQVAEVAGDTLSVPVIETMVRDQINLAYMSGRMEANRDPAVDEILWGYEYVTVGDDRVRPEHAMLDGVRLPKDDPFWRTNMPPNGFNCFLPGTRVRGAFVAGLEARYSGMAVEIETARGRRLAVTANHPVLTCKGWTPAASLNEGDTCFGYSGVVNQVFLGDVDDQDRPALIEDVVQSLRLEGRAYLQVASLDLYGDGRNIQGDVEVVGVNGELMQDRERRPEQVGDSLLVSADDDLSLESRAGREAQRLVRGSPAGGRLPSRLALGHNLAARELHLGPLGQLGFALAADRGAVLEQESEHAGSRGFELVGQSFERSSRRVLGDDGLGDPLPRGSQGVGRPDFGAVRTEKRAHGSRVNPVGTGNLGGAGTATVSRQHRSAVGRKPLRCGLAANLNVMASEKLEHGFAAHAQFIGELIRAGSGLVASDQVTRIRKFHYEGSVYDLQSTTGWMIANDVLTSNCRCTVIEVFNNESLAEDVPPPSAQEFEGRLIVPGADKGWQFNPGDLFRS